MNQIIVKSEAELQGALSHARQSGALVLLSGTGTRQVAAPATNRPLQQVSLAGLDAIVRYEPADFYIECMAGVKLSALASVLAEKRLHFPFLAADAKGTIGGMAATGQLLAASQCYNISRWVIAVKVMLASGETIKTGAVTYKSVAGYDLPKLFAGSFGTLGVILSATLRCYAEGTQPYGKDMLPVTRRVPILGGSLTEVPQRTRAEVIAGRLKQTLDPAGILPVITGWSAV